jgi:predicted nucleic acid-binding protein
VIIDVLRNNNNDKVALLRKALDSKVSCGISIYTYTEVLQGARSEKEFSILEAHLSVFEIYYLPNEAEPYKAAAKLFLDLRKKGKTIRSTLDILIAETAITNGLYLLHNDRDFDVITENVSDLKIYE